MALIKKIAKTLFGNLIQEEALIAGIKTAIRCKNIQEFGRLIHSNYYKLSEYRDEEGITLLHWAAEAGTETIIENLLEYGDLLVDTMSNDGKTPLHVAAYYGHIKAAKTLLRFGAKINLREDNPPSKLIKTPMNNAIASKQKKMVKFLLEEGADIEASDNMYNSLFLALENGDSHDIVKILLEHGADPKSTAPGGCTVLHYDAEWAESGGMLREFVNMGVPVDARKDDGKTSLFETVHFNQISNAELLISMGADVNAKDNNENTVLHRVAREGDRSLDMAILFINNGTDINAMNIYGETPIHIAVFGSNIEITKLLIESGVNLNATMNDSYERDKAIGSYESDKNWCDGWTPLHLAAKSFSTDAIELLIRNGADVNARNEMGWTPLDVAITKADVVTTKGSQERVAILRKHGGQGLLDKKVSKQAPVKTGGISGFRLRRPIVNKTILVIARERNHTQTLQDRFEMNDYKAITLGPECYVESTAAYHSDFDEYLEQADLVEYFEQADLVIVANSVWPKPYETDQIIEKLYATKPKMPLIIMFSHPSYTDYIINKFQTKNIRSILKPFDLSELLEVIEEILQVPV